MLSPWPCLFDDVSKSLFAVNDGRFLFNENYMKLLALILAYLVSHQLKQPQRFRSFTWFKKWSQWFEKQAQLSNKELLLLLIIAIPVALISFILMNIFDSSLGMLVVSILVLSYCIGPESLEEEVESQKVRSKLTVKKEDSVAVLIKKMTQASLKRWFGIFFWYLLLGIVGALMYRLAERLDAGLAETDSKKPVITKFLHILNYPVSWFMVVSLAIASDFERIYKKCKPFMTLDNIKKMDDSFLYSAADFAVENCEVEEDDKKNIEQVTISVLKRMLVVWLVFAAILVILAV